RCDDARSFATQQLVTGARSRVAKVIALPRARVAPCDNQGRHTAALCSRDIPQHASVCLLRAARAAALCVRMLGLGALHLGLTALSCVPAATFVTEVVAGMRAARPPKRE